MELTSAALPPTREIRVDHPSAAHRAGSVALSAARAAGLSDRLADRAAVIATELATNLDRHARDGALYVQPLPGGGIDITAVDLGPGMADPDAWLADGRSSAGTLGVGLGAVRRQAGWFRIHSVPGGGTTVAVRLRPAPVAEPLLGHVLLPAAGQQVSGDAAALVTHPDGVTALVVDGLGHGEQAATAARAAVRATLDAQPARTPRPLPDLLAALHTALRPTRGAAVALLRLRGTTGGVEAELRGLGNISCRVQRPGGAHRELVSHPGIAGLHPATPPPQRLALDPGDQVVLHTDGVTRPPGDLPALAPPLLAGLLAHQHRVPRDDATVLVLRVPAAGAAR